MEWLGADEDFFDGRQLQLPNGDAILSNELARAAPRIFNSFMNEHTWMSLAKRLIAERKEEEE